MRVFGEVWSEIPREQFLDTIYRVLRDSGKDVPQITSGIDSVRLSCSDQTIDRCGALTTAVGPSEQTVFFSQERLLVKILPRRCYRPSSGRPLISFSMAYRPAMRSMASTATEDL